MAMKKQYRIALHIIACLLFLIVPVFFATHSFMSLKDVPLAFIIKDLFRNLLVILFFYVNYLYLIPQFYLAKRFLIYILILFGTLLVITFLPTLLVFQQFTPVFPAGGSSMHYHDRTWFGSILLEVRLCMYLYISVVFASILFRLNYHFKQLQTEKMNSELSYLKAQINPHFLFNTLNSIYSLAIEKSPNTAPSIIKLSSMMRYVISDTANKYVSLEKEMNYINSYIELQKIRLGDTANVNFSFSGDTEHKIIAPLVLIPFIENAFKHGVNPEEPSQIDIQISVSDTNLYLHVFNLKVPHIQDHHTKSGYGLKNGSEQLNIIYPNKHHLQIEDKEHSFTVTLKIEIV